MRNTLALLFILSAAAPALAQGVPPRGANTILIQMPDSGMAAWRATASALVARGYVIKSSDKDLLTLSCEPKEVRRAGNLSLNASVQGNQVALAGNMFIPVAGNTANRITYRGMVGSPFMMAWQEMQAVATSLKGRVSYQTRP